MEVMSRGTENKQTGMSLPAGIFQPTTPPEPERVRGGGAAGRRPADDGPAEAKAPKAPEEEGAAAAGPTRSRT